MTGKDEIFKVGRCPYCGDEVEIEPTDMCCSEVHGEYVYEDADGNEYTESEYLISRTKEIHEHA